MSLTPCELLFAVRRRESQALQTVSSIVPLLTRLCIVCACLSADAVAAALPVVDARAVPVFSAVPFLPTDTFEPATNPVVLSVVTTPGEMEAASFAVRARHDESTVSFRVSNLEGSAGVISSASVDLKYVIAWYQASGAWRSARVDKPVRGVLTPELLVHDPELVEVDFARRANRLKLSNGEIHRYVDISSPDASLDLSQDSLAGFRVYDAAELKPVRLEPRRSQQVMVTVTVPDGAQAGRYLGSIDVVSGGHTLTSIAVELDVLPYQLVPSPLTYGIYYRGQLGPEDRRLSSDIKSLEQLRLELADIAAHGIEYPTVFQGNSNPATRGDIRSFRAPGVLDTYLGLRTDIGYPKDHIFYLGVGAHGAANDEDYSNTLLKRFEDHGYERVYFYGLDEAFGDRLKAQRPDWERLREQGGRIFAANNKHDLVEQGMADVLDVAILARDLRPDEAYRLRSAGVELVLSYNNPQSAVENPASYRKNYGFSLIGAGYDGAMIYAYQHGFGSIWNDFDHPRWRDHCLTYPTDTGVVSTLAWEAVREAIDDVRYIATLEAYLERARGEDSDRWHGLRSDFSLLRARLTNGSEWNPRDIRARIIEMTLEAIRLRREEANEQRAAIGASL